MKIYNLKTSSSTTLAFLRFTDYPQLFRIFVKTTAGTYVKEWVHGEFGRTQPSLGAALSCKVDLLALDVTAVHLEWPPVRESGTVE